MDSLWAIEMFQVWSSSKRKVILSRDFIFDKISMLHSKSDEDLGKAKDATKQV